MHRGGVAYMDQINKNPGASTKTINTKLMEMSQELQFIGLFFFFTRLKAKRPNKNTYYTLTDVNACTSKICTE